jgi:hypothetical protein
VAVTDLDSLSRDELKEILAERHDHCVSLFLSLEQVGQESPSDGIRMKNLVKQAEAQLTARGVRHPDAQAILAPANEIVREPLRWQSDGSGLAIFMSEDGARRYKLPQRFEDLVIVNDRFHIEQLLPLFNGEGRFYVLALSRNRVRVYVGTQHTIKQIAIPEMPASLEEATQYDTYQSTLRYYSNAGNQPGARQQQPMFYGQGTTKDFIKKETEGFFRTVDRALYEALKLEKAPLVLAALAEEVPEYRNVNTYPHLAEQAISNGPQLLGEDELHRRAWEIVQPVFARSAQDALDRFGEYNGTGRASDSLEEIVPAAVFGRVESLLVPSGTHLWGAFDPQTGQVEPHDERREGDEDLIDLAASYALATRGEVIQLPPEMMPEGATAAAVFRY